MKDNIREFVKELKEMVNIFVKNVFGQYLIQKKIHNTQKVTVECNSKISEGCSINTTISYRFLTKNLKKIMACIFVNFVLLI